MTAPITKCVERLRVAGWMALILSTLGSLPVATRSCARADETPAAGGEAIGSEVNLS
jgi:hypothetical protein